MAAARSMQQIAAFYGRSFSAERLNECDTADCFLISSNGFSLNAHYSLIVDWLGENVPFPTFQNQIHLPISDSALQLLIDVIYHRMIHSWTPVFELINYSVGSQWWQLVDDLLNRGWEHIESSGIPKCWLLARDRSLPCELELRQRVADVAPYIILNEGPEYADLVSIQIAALLDLLKDDRIYWDCAETTFKVICAWSSVNRSCAKENCQNLFKALRYSSISERRDCIAAFKGFFRNLGVDESTLNQATNVYTSFKPRIPRSLLLYMGGWTQRQASKSSYFYDTSADHWAPIPKLNLEDRLSYFRVAYIDKKLYVVGGFTDGRFRTEVYKYDFGTMKWKPGPSLNETKGYFTLATLNRQIYLIGGSDGRVRSPVVERLDCASNSWEILPPMSVGRSDAASVAFRNRIWVFGGFDGVRTLNRVETFDPTTYTWNDMVPMIEPRSGHCAVNFHDKLFVLGGFQHGHSTNAVEFYNPQTGHWAPAPSMILERSNFSAVVFESCIYVMGGHVGESTLDHCEKFDGERWIPVHCLPKPIAAGATIYIDKPTNIAKLLDRKTF